MMTCRMTSHSYWWRGTVQLSWTAVQYSCILPWTAWVRAHEDGGRTASDGRWTLKIVPPESPHPPAGFLFLFLSLRAILPKPPSCRVWEFSHWCTTCKFTRRDSQHTEQHTFFLNPNLDLLHCQGCGWVSCRFTRRGVTLFRRSVNFTHVGIP